MITVEYVSDQYLARAAAYPGLIVYSRPMQIERRIGDRRLTPRPDGDRRESVAQLLLDAYPEFQVQT